MTEINQVGGFDDHAYPSFVRFPAEHPEISLSDNDVHLWLVSFHLARSRVDGLRLLLSKNEIERAEAFRSSTDGDRFIVAHGLLRTILGYYTGVLPSNLQFWCGPRGKPKLANQPKGDKIQFNLSHSADLAIYIIARNRNVGVDLEHIRPVPEANQLVKRFFCAQEKAAFQALSPEEQPRAFFRYWTCKEAYVKAIGQGLALSPDRFCVSIASGTPFRLLAVGENHREASRWSFCEFQPELGYIATCAVEGEDLNLSFWQWTG